MNKKRNTIEYLKSFYIKDYLLMALAIVIYTVGLTGFIMPNQVVSGGLAGVALLLNYATGINVSSTIFVVNAILLVLAFRPLGQKFVINTIIGAGMLTLGVKLGEMYLKPYFLANPPVHDPFIAIVLGGIFMGVALGLVYSVNGSTGGVDIIGFLVTKYFKIRISRILLYVDVLIVLSSIFVLKGYTAEKMVLGLILLPVMYQAVDVVMNGAKQAIQVTILSKKYEEIATHINTELKRGCTVVDGMGWYTKNPQKVIIVFARRGEGTTIFRLVNSIDPEAFVTRTNVEAVYGKGFEKFN
nr:YitT family protein [uncultured Capnocytophaga sp.]